MSNILISKPYAISAISAQDEDSNFPVSNLLKANPDFPYRSAASTTALAIEIDLGSAQAVECLLAGYTSATGTATARWRGATSQANLTAAPGYDPGVDDPANVPGGSGKSLQHSLHIPSSAQTFRWWRLDLDDSSPANPDGYVDIGAIILGDAFIPAINIAPGFTRGFVHRSTPRTLEGGGQSPIKRARNRSATIRLGELTEAEFQDEILRLEEELGNDEPMLIVLDPGDSTRLWNKIYYGYAQYIGQATTRGEDYVSSVFRIEDLGL